MPTGVLVGCTGAVYECDFSLPRIEELYWNLKQSKYDFKTQVLMSLLDNLSSAIFCILKNNLKNKNAVTTICFVVETEQCVAVTILLFHLFIFEG